MILALTIFFILLLVFSVIDFVKVQSEFRTLLLFCSSLVLVFFITFRFNVPDYDSYVEIFNEVTLSLKIGANSGIHGEYGFLLLNAVIKVLGGGPKELFAVVGITSIFLTLLFYRKYTSYYLIALLVYFSHIFLLREMIQIRSGMAIAGVMFSIPYIEQRKFFKFIGVVLVASLFHSICLLFTLVYFAFPLLQKTKIQIVVLSAGMVLGVVFNLSVIEKVLLFFSVPPLVLDYLHDEQYNYSLGLFNPVLIKNLMLLAVLIKNREYFTKEVKYFNTVLIAYIIGTFWLSAFNAFAIFSARIATMFSNGEHVLIPSLLLLNKYRILAYTIIIIYCIYSFVSKWQMLATWSFNI